MNITKKHCSRHYRYVANCPDCVAVNESSDSERDKDISLNSDNNENHDDNSQIGPEIPNIDERTQKVEPQRYHYERIKRKLPKKKIIITLSVIGIIIALIVIFYAYPLWHAKISLQEQLYANKAGVNFWSYYTLNYWNTSFFFNKIGLFGAIIGCLIFSIPPERTLISLLGTRLSWGKPSRKKALFFIWTIGFIIFYLIIQAINPQSLSLTLYMIESGSLTISPETIFNGLSVFYNPNGVSMKDMYIYSSLVYPIITYLLVLIIIRYFIVIIENAYLTKNHYKILSNIFMIISLFFAIGYFAMPLESIDGLTLLYSYCVLIGFIGFMCLGIISYIVGIRKAKIKIFNITRTQGKRIIQVIVVVVIILVIPLFISIPTAIKIDNDYQEWTKSRWDIQIQREIAWTQTAAGIDGFSRQSINNYISKNSTTESDLLIVDGIRQYDKIIAGKRMDASIHTYFETIGDSDIIYRSGKGEYWVAPKTIDTAGTATDPVNRHTEIYDHVEGFLALDTSSGEFVNESDYYDIFGVKSDYPIFFGEEADTSTLNADSSSPPISAFSDDILLNTGWGNASVYKYHYNEYGVPDGTLTGQEAFLYCFNMGLTGSALDSTEKSFLINRNIKDRVRAILLPGLWIDSDPYLIFNSTEGKLYYALSIGCSLQINSFAKSPVYRFLGVVLIDVTTGNLLFYQNPSLVASFSDPLYELWRIYINSYPWQTCPEWLKEQLRYPEQLFEAQLKYDYIYHVSDDQVWFSKNDFYKRPTNGDTYYIETDLGSGLEFVGIDIVEYSTQDTSTLAGFYIVRHGDHFGEVVFYYTDKTAMKFIGPNFAENEFIVQASQKYSLIPDPRTGNIILYPIANGIYYFIPIYATFGSNEQLSMAGLINADTKKVGWGSGVLEAYNDLDISVIQNNTIQNVSLSISGNDTVIYNPEQWAEFDAYVKNLDTNDTHPRRNLTLNLSIYHETGANVTVFGNYVTNSTFTWGDGKIAYTYLVGNWTAENALYPGQGNSITVKVLKDPGSAASISMWYQFNLYEDGVLITSSLIDTLTFENNEEP